MKTSPALRASLALAIATCLALVAAAPTAAAQSSEAPQCNPQPLGTGGGIVGDVKDLGNTAIYGGCVFAVSVGAAAFELVADVVNLVCVFATGEPCIDGNIFQSD